MSFAVIEVLMDYDYPENVKCLKLVDSQEAGLEYKKEIQDNDAKTWLAREKYIREYVNNFEMPVFPKTQYGVTDYWEWTEKYPVPRHIPSDKFKECLISSLLRHYQIPQHADYNPPKYSSHPYIFVVKLDSENL